MPPVPRRFLSGRGAAFRFAVPLTGRTGPDWAGLGRSCEGPVRHTGDGPGGTGQRQRRHHDEPFGWHCVRAGRGSGGGRPRPGTGSRDQAVRGRRHLRRHVQGRQAARTGHLPASERLRIQRRLGRGRNPRTGHCEVPERFGLRGPVRQRQTRRQGQDHLRRRRHLRGRLGEGRDRGTGHCAVRQRGRLHGRLQEGAARRQGPHGKPERLCLRRRLGDGGQAGKGPHHLPRRGGLRR